MKNIFRRSLVLSTFAVVTVASTAAVAQTPIAPGGNDHEALVGHLGVGYLGRRSMPVGTLDNEVSAPVVGVRYWINRQIGIDAGLGFGMISGSEERKEGGVTTKNDSPSTTVFILHGGVPISLMSGKHYSFQITPEMNLGVGSGSSEDVLDNKTDTSGFHLDLGARAGSEIHFGFIGLPEVSLLANIGLSLATDSVSVDSPGALVNGAPGPRTERNNSQTVFGTNVGNSPWSIFTSSVGAVYYF